jgi:hypothetical protein
MFEGSSQELSEFIAVEVEQLETFLASDEGRTLTAQLVCPSRYIKFGLSYSGYGLRGDFIVLSNYGIERLSEDYDFTSATVRQLVGRQAATVQDAVSIFYATTLALRDEQLLLPWLRSQL